MTTFFIKISLFIILTIISLCGNVRAQEGIFINWQPEFSTTYRLNDRWQVNGKLVSFSTFARPGPEGTVGNYQLNNLEIRGFGTYRFLNRTSLSIGYMYRVVDPFEEVNGYEHRLMEQTAFITRLGPYRLGNRIRFEQRWRSTVFVHRWRYRLSVDWPLMGESLDPRELYLIASEEILWSFGKSVNNFGENRTTGGLGWFVSPTTKFEAHMQYRITGINSGSAFDMLLFITTMYINI